MIRIGLSGMMAYKFGAQINANNIANVNTPGYKKIRAKFSETTNSSSNISRRNAGVVWYSHRVDFNNAMQSNIKDSNVNIAEEIVNLIVNQRGFETNANSVKTADAILKTTIDIKK